MKRFTRSMILALIFGAAAGCGTETVDADTFFMSTGNATSVGPDTYLAVSFWSSDDVAIAAGTTYRMRIDGHWAVFSPEDPEVLHFLGIGGQTLLAANNLVSGSHTIEFLDPSGKVVLRTAPLTLTPSRGNQLVVYGNISQLQYRFFTYAKADLDAVPTDQILARVMNVRTDKQTVIVGCSPTSAGECAPAKLAHGQVWERTLPRSATLFADGSQHYLNIECMVPSAKGMVPPTVVTYVLDVGAYTELYDFSEGPTCRQAQ